MSNRTVKTKSGRELTQGDLERLAEEAQAGYDLTKARRRRVGRPALGDTGPSPRVSVRVEPVAYRKLRERARSEDTTVSTLARRLLESSTSASGSLEAAARALTHTESLIRSMTLPSAAMAQVVTPPWLEDVASTFAAAQHFVVDLERVARPLADFYRQADQMAALLPKVELFDHIVAARMAVGHLVSGPQFAVPRGWGSELTLISDAIAASARTLVPALANLPDLRLGVLDVAVGWRHLVEAQEFVVPTPPAGLLLTGGRGVLGVNLAAGAGAGVDVDVDEDLVAWDRAPQEMRGLLLGRLRELDEMLPGKLEGAWERVTRLGPDAASQAANSLIELLDWSLRRATDGVDLVAWHAENQRPPTELDQGHATRTLRVRYLCRDDFSRDIVDAFVRIIGDAYGSLQGVKHKGRTVDPVVIRRLIPTVEAVLTFVFVR